MSEPVTDSARQTSSRSAGRDEKAAVDITRHTDSDAPFRAVFGASPDAMLILDDEGRCRTANAEAVRLFGQSVDALHGRRLAEIVGAASPSGERWAEMDDGGPALSTWRFVRVAGDARDLEATLTRHVRPGVHLLLVRDVTHRQRDGCAHLVREAALNAAANGIVITDAEGRIEWINPGFTKMTGYVLDEIRGQTTRVLKSDRQDETFYADLWRTIRAGRVWQGELVNRRKDGTLYDEEQSITPVRSAVDGTIAHYVAIKQDITDRKRADSLVRRSEAYYRSLIENALDLIIVLDREGMVHYASPSIERILGYRPHEIIGTRSQDRLHPDDVGPITTLLAVGSGTPGFTASVEYRIRHKDGSWHSCEAVASNLLDHPSIAGIIVNARDITERRRAEAEQHRLREQLNHSEKLAAMSELLAGVAHELNNPLAVVIGHTALLGRSTDTAVAARAEKIGRAAERCGRIVKNFLALARQYPPERRPVNLNQVVDDALEVMAYALRVDDVHVVTALDPDLPMLAADGHQLQQVLVNLVGNAHQAMHTIDRSRRLTIRSSLDRAGNRVCLEVADSGPGIAPEVRVRLFEPFFTTKPVGQGTGLGLSICRGIIESHGGEINVDEASGEGATFRVMLPVGTGVPASLVPEDDGPVIAPRRILIVDDEPEVADVVAEMLRGDGHHVCTSVDGADALRHMRDEPHDVVVSDMKMPHLDGPALWWAVHRSDPPLSGRFVFLTGDTLGASTGEFLEQTGAPSLKKPFLLRDLRRALAAVSASDLAEAVRDGAGRAGES